jgi:hypothetical protein
MATTSKKTKRRKTSKTKMNGLTKVKEDLHRLVDELPDEEVHPAKRYLEYLRNMGDPAYRVFIEAPIDDEPLTPGEIKAIKEGREAYLRGETIPAEEIKRQLLE